MGKNRAKRTNRRERPYSNKRTARVENPDSFYDQKPIWKFQHSDFEKSKWNIENCDVTSTQLLRKLSNFESMTWSEIIRATGGRSRGNNHHFIEISKMSKEAQKRAKELNIEHYESLFSLRLTGKSRLFGILTDGIFRIVWFDPNHEIYKTK